MTTARRLVSRFSALSSVSAADAAIMALTVVCAYALKHHYSVASDSDLRWILAPTSQLVGVIRGIDFVPEAGIGYVSREIHYAVAPVCAGVNFLIVAFGAAVFSFVRSAPTLLGKVTVFVASFAGAYLATLVVNAVRILIAIELRAGGLAHGWMTPARVHRAEGVVVYVAFLSLFFIVAQRFAARREDAAHS